MTLKQKLSNSGVQNVALEDIDAADYLYFVDAQTKKVYRLTHETLLAWLEQELDIDAGSASAITSPDASATVTALDDGQVLTTIDDVPVETVELAQRQLRHVLDSGRTVEVSIGDQGAWGAHLSGIVETVSSPGAPPFNIEDGAPTDPTYRYGLRVLGDASALGGVTEGVSQFLADSTGLALQFIGRAGSRLTNGFSVQGFAGEIEGATAGVVAQIVEGAGRLIFTGRLQVQTLTTGTPDAGSMLWCDSSGFVRVGDAPVPTAVSEALDEIEDELADHEERIDDLEAAASGTPTAITVYDTAASGNYPIPAGAKAVYRRVIGAGGGGGGGGASAGASARSGGAGGAGGAVATGWISGAELAGGTIAYVVGAGGTAGAGTASGDGADGGVGGQSSAGALIAYGGGGGRRGLTIAAVAGGGGGGGTGGPGTVGAAGTVAGGLPGASSAAAIGGQGAQGGASASACAEYGGGAGGGHNTSAFFPGGSSLYGGGGGGAGAGANGFPAVTTPSAGGTSGSYTPGGGGAAGTSGASPTAGAAGTAADSTLCGSGGGGGGSTVTANTAGAAGGAGGAGGGGGGGGGSGTNTGAGGAGGVGGAGRVEFYAFF